jgi:hypothetical protein
MSAGVTQFVKERRVIGFRTLEPSRRRHVDCIRGRQVAGAVSFMDDHGPLWHVHHDPFTLLDRIEGAELWQLQPGRQGGSQLTLFGVPHQMVAEERPC